MLVDYDQCKSLMKDLGIKKLPTFRLYVQGDCKFETSGVKTLEDELNELAKRKEIFTNEWF